MYNGHANAVADLGLILTLLVNSHGKFKLKMKHKKFNQRF